MVKKEKKDKVFVIRGTKSDKEFFKKFGKSPTKVFRDGMNREKSKLKSTKLIKVKKC